MKYRAKLRGIDLVKLADVLQYTTEHYWDQSTQRQVAAGRYDKQLVLIPYDRKGDVVIPVTVHTTSRQQINFRLKTGRFSHEEDTPGLL